MNYSNYLKFLIFLSLVISFFFSCQKDSFITDTDAKLSFSMDTVLFDTVFTTIGSTTQQLRVLNKHNKTIQISEIYLAGGDISNFRLNINGVQTIETENIEIAANDSMYIFIEVTVDPNDQNSPLIITDSIIFSTNGNIQDINLVAWGQDAFFHSANTYMQFISGVDTFHFPYHTIHENPVWTNEKPHVVYGYVGIDANDIFTIEAGTQIHFHYNSGIIVWPGGSLKVNGELGNEVVFQGDRLEEFYDELPGQWDRIWLYGGSINNEINYAIIKNAIIGLHVDTVFNSNPTLKISNTKIENMNAIGIFAQGAVIEADNCVIANCGQHSVALSIGGKYRFNHCTIANYWTHSSRASQAALLLNNYYKDVYGNFQIRDLEEAYFGNCLIYGSIEDEIGFDYFPNEGIFNYKFDHCLMKMYEPGVDTTDTETFINIKYNLEPNFISTISPFDYQLDTLSAAKDQANINISLMFPIDLNGNKRLENSTSDIGAFERVE
ncbi:MAG: hypothetical protein HN704_01145 [Bacteroidetes bacterium]|jgi:hypothetical protein|nr:hypothetical protein [Bacteroidota bacterium]MBT6686290.1 hypothetical protein [Bacteroidota bacterium]MBT7145092.1 hypothetical protein [Bacteroidota bacterium]MBT7490190.1 hypothetical protein [Bacteroidota bacterium]